MTAIVSFLRISRAFFKGNSFLVATFSNTPPKLILAIGKYKDYKIYKYYKDAIASISIRASFGSLETSTVALAGLFSLKKLP